METAKLFQDGDNQAVRLPAGYRFAGNRVHIKRMGDAVILLPFPHTWDVLFDSLDHFTDDFMAEREQPAQQERKTLTRPH